MKRVAGVAIDPGTQEKLRGLTTLRFLAAFWVFIFHFNLRAPLGFSQFVRNIVANGAIAMPVFFMLSGLVLGYRYRDAYKGFGPYYLARIARIVPAYFLCILLTGPLLVAYGDWGEPIFWAGALFALAISVVLMQAWYPNLFGFWHFGGTWSISVEMFLYACFPVVRVVSHYGSKVLIALAVACAAVSASLVPSLGLPMSSSLPFAVFYAVPAYHLPEFVIGVVLSVLLLRHGVRPAFAIALPLLFMFIGLAGGFNPRYMALNVVVLPLVAFTLYGFASLDSARESRIARLLVNRPFDYLGDISYSFFLMHLPVVRYLDYNRALVESTERTALFAAAFAVTTVLALASYHIVEPRGRRLVMHLGRTKAVASAFGRWGAH